MELTADFKSYQEKITSSLVNVTRSAGQISSQDLSFHRSANEKFSQSLDDQNVHLLRLTNKLLKAATRDTSIKIASLQDSDDVEDKWRRIVDVVDDLLEKADASLDEFTGALKRLSPAVSDAEPSPKRLKPTSGLESWSQANVPKPQLLFQKKVNNYETGPWKPLLTSKPHAIKTLDESLVVSGDTYQHPYLHEIENLQFPPSLYQVTEPTLYTPPEASEAVFVDTEEAVQQMLEELKLAKEIAVDLEHNDKNSYVGMVCLMQISTRNKDWIVDTLKPWRENLQILNEVFADPNIVKVFHGSTSDIVWLQRDLGLYIVGLFDTYHACNVLAFPGKGLKYLLHRFANFEAQKQYQLADWRIRPLPKELLDYARSDTHFLLYIYDQLRNMLLESSTPDENLMTRVLEASKRECLQVYERHTYDTEDGLGPAGWLRLLMTRSTGFTNEQFGVFRALHEWRDQKARQLDEGEQNVLPNNFIFAWAEEMPTRKPMFFIRGLGRMPPIASSYLPEIIAVIWNGREAGKKGPSIYEAIEKNGDKVGHMFGRNKYIRKKAEDATKSVGIGATVQMLNRNGILEIESPKTEVHDASDTTLVRRISSSELFGGVDPIFTPATPNHSIIEQALQSVLRLDLVEGLQNAIGSEEMVSAVASEPLHPITNGVSQIQSQQNEIFTIRDRSKKRKTGDALADYANRPHADQLPSEFVEQQQHSGNDDHSGQKVYNEAGSTKRQKKAERKARKAQEDAERNRAQGNMVPFDYANAQPIFHAKADEVSNGVTSKTKPLNPFLRALDTSTGARRSKAGKELPGRSHTFTS